MPSIIAAANVIAHVHQQHRATEIPQLVNYAPSRCRALPFQLYELVHLTSSARCVEARNK